MLQKQISIFGKHWYLSVFKLHNDNQIILI